MVESCVDLTKRRVDRVVVVEWSATRAEIGGERSEQAGAQLYQQHPELEAELSDAIAGVWREHQAEGVVVFVDAVETLVGAAFADGAVAIPHFAVLALALSLQRWTACRT